MRATAAVLMLLPLTGCDMIFDLLDSGPDVAAAEGKLIAGDLPAADAAYAEAAAAAPTNVDAATGAAYMALLRGDYAAADALLAAAEPGATEAGPQAVADLNLRRALIALEAGELEDVRKYGEQSGAPVGQLLAAEVALADGEREEAAELLRAVRGGQAEETARSYLELIEDDNPLVAGLSEATALWSLGEEKVAVRSVEELFKALPDDQDGRDELLLVWASRAATVGETGIARGLVESLIFAPDGQGWRKTATLAIIACAEGDGDTCVEEFGRIETTAPSDGLADAKATAASLIADQDADVARQLAGSLRTGGAARALLEAGDRAAAAKAAPSGPLKSYLESGG